jgi:hypothetical protein
MSNFNGWKNYETWNVSLWLANDETLYNLAKKRRTYSAVVRILARLGETHTPDGVSYSDKRLSRRELTAAIREF